MLTIFKEKKIAYVAAVVSLLLQIISFMTTWQGAQYYFGEIFFAAPLLFAIAVQSVVYFLENSIRAKRNFIKIATLTLAIICSSYFSYIGIYNAVNSPLTYYQETYTGYRNQLITEYDNLLDKADTRAQKSLNQVVSSLSTKYTQKKIQLQETKDLLKQLNGVKASVSGGMAAPQRNQYGSYEEYAAAYSQYLSSSVSGNKKETTSNTKTLLKKYGYTSRAQVAKEYAVLKGQRNNIVSAVKNIARAYGVSTKGDSVSVLQRVQNGLSAEITQGKESATGKTAIRSLVTLAATYDTKIDKKSAETMLQCIRLNGSAKNSESLMKAYDKVSVSSPSRCKSRMNWEISQAVSELNRVAKVLGISKQYQVQNYPLEDIYVLPIVRLLHMDTMRMAVLCLIIALSTDLLSLLFAMMFCPDKDILAVKSVSDLVNREQSLFGRNVFSALELGLKGRNMEPNQSNMKEELSEFINCFQASNVSINEGFTLEADMGQMKNYQILLALLCQLNMAKLVSAKDYAYLSGQGEGNAKPGQDYVLLRTKFLLWCSDVLDGEVAA